MGGLGGPGVVVPGAGKEEENDDDVPDLVENETFEVEDAPKEGKLEELN